MTWYSTHYPDSSITDWEQATVLEADAYHLLRGNSTWIGTEEIKTQALQRSWDYLGSLVWRDDVFDTELPEKVKEAQIVGALYELIEQGSLQPTISSEDFLIKKNIAGAIIKEYKQGSPSRKRYLSINSLLAPFLKNSGASNELRRG